MAYDAYSETVFWTRQFEEHLEFLSLLFTDKRMVAEAKRLGAHYKSVRARALRNRVKAVDIIRPINRQVHEYQSEALARLMKGEFLGWAFPLFVEHVTREMDLYSHLVDGTDAPMGGVDATVKQLGLEHALFAAHLLDPSESALVGQAFDAASSMQPLVNDSSANAAAADVERAIGQFVIDNRLGRLGGALSIIPMGLANHVIREQQYFSDKLEG